MTSSSQIASIVASIVASMAAQCHIPEPTWVSYPVPRRKFMAKQTNKKKYGR